MSEFYDIAIQDVEYLPDADEPLQARLYKPQGLGPFPAMVHVHGGAWTRCDRTTDERWVRLIAERGVTVVSIDFRSPPVAAYPASIADINYAIRWTKVNADKLNTTPERVGVMGGSSGGHQAVLTAMRTTDERYTSRNLPKGSEGQYDASVHCVIAFWPVIDPLGRFHFMEELHAKGELPAITPKMLFGHNAYWETKEAMSEGSPVRILQRHESISTPPILVFGSPNDPHHPFAHLESFMTSYSMAGGHLEAELSDKAFQSWFTADPNSLKSQTIFDRIAKFLDVPSPD